MTKRDFYLEVLQPIKLNRDKLSLEDEERILEIGRRFDSRMFFQYDKTSQNQNPVLEMFIKAVSKIYQHMDYLTVDEQRFLFGLLKKYNI